MEGRSRRQPTLRAFCYTAAAGSAPFVALGFGAPEALIAVVPAMAALVIGVVRDPSAAPALDIDVDVDETLEGHRVEMTLALEGRGRRAHVTLELPPGVSVEDVDGGRRSGPGGLVAPLVKGSATVIVGLRAREWGTHPLGAATVVVAGPLRMALHTTVIPPSHTLVVLPEEEVVRRLVEPLATNMHVGDVVARERGAGSEVADVRPRVPGDPPKSINWRATLRSGEVQVTERQAERNGDLVLVVDSVVEPGSETRSVVTHLVRVAAALVDAYGAARHRLGLVAVSGFTRWFGLESGTAHVHRLLASLMRTQAVADPVWLVIDRVIDRNVRRPSMVVFVTSLLEEEMVGRMMRLSAAGIDVVAFVWDPGPDLSVPEDERRRLARRIWVMERERTADRLRSAGVAVGSIGHERNLDETLEEVERWRRMLRRAPV